jgi:hypothetical protein
MSEKSKATDQRADRLAAALRENLKRRKAQARARAAKPADPAKKQQDAGLSPQSDGDWKR